MMGKRSQELQPNFQSANCNKKTIWRSPAIEWCKKENRWSMLRLKFANPGYCRCQERFYSFHYEHLFNLVLNAFATNNIYEKKNIHAFFYKIHLVVMEENFMYKCFFFKYFLLQCLSILNKHNPRARTVLTLGLNVMQFESDPSRNNTHSIGEPW